MHIYVDLFGKVLLKSVSRKGNTDLDVELPAPVSAGKTLFSELEVNCIMIFLHILQYHVQYVSFFQRGDIFLWKITRLIVDKGYSDVT